MRGLGRLFALPWLLIALAAQALAPAEAAAMQPAASPYGICSAHDLGGGSHRSDPAKHQDHDCCAFACALTGLGAAPPAPLTAARTPFAEPAELAALARQDVANPSAVERPRSRGPPSPIPTI
jgi:DUF2946 family protein